MQTTKEELSHIISVISSSNDIPEPTKSKTLHMISGSSYVAKTDLINIRNNLLFENQYTLPANSTWGRAEVVANEVKKKRRGGRSQYAFIDRADSISRLPVTQRAIHDILKKRG